MINLLPPAAKRTFGAGRVNALLIRYIWITIALFGLLGLLCALTFAMLEGARQASQQQINANNADVASLASVQAQSDTFAANLAISKSILDQQTHYTDTLLKISQFFVPGTTISVLSLDETSYGAPVTLQIAAVSEQAALQLKTSMQSSTLFSDVHFQSISLNPGGTGTTGYPVSAQLVVTINKEGL